MDDLDVKKLVLNGKVVDVNVADSITGGDLTLTIEGASTFTVNIHDPELSILGSGIFNNRVIAVMDGVVWQLVKVSKSGDGLSITFEEYTVARLRKKDSPRKVYRDKMTRAQFVLQLVRELKSPRVPVFIPELKVRQPIATSSDRQTEDQRVEDHEPGFDAKVRFTVKGEQADREQISIAERMLDVARSKKAPATAKVALIAAGIAESLLRNLTTGHSSSVGVLQLLDTHLNGSTSTKGGRRDVELVTSLFLDRGFTGRGGAIALSKSDNDPASIATKVQGNRDGASTYAPYVNEARRIVSLYEGGDGSFIPGEDDEDSGQAKVERYEFRRGQPGEKEDSWTAIQRLAEEVKWRAFVVRGRFYFVSDNRLIRAKPSYRIEPKTEGVLNVDFDLDVGKAVETARLDVVIGRWQVLPGQVVVLDGFGPADGRYLVSGVSRGLFSTVGNVELIRPVSKLPEPAASTTSDSSTTEAGGAEGLENVPEAQRSRRGVKPVAASYRPPGPHGAARNAFGDTEAADILVPQGTNALAVADGVIESVRSTGNFNPNSNPNGIHVYLKTSDNRFFYTHLFSVNVKAGDRVSAGDVIGKTGAANGVAHLHFEVENGSIKDWV